MELIIKTRMLHSDGSSIGFIAKQSLHHMVAIVRKLKNRIICKISDPDVAESAKNAQTTRAQASMRACAEELNGGIVAIGNAPTALLEIIKMANEGICNPALIVGIPVGFISAVESKNDLALTNLPYITNMGRKGGSPSAAAIINAIYKLAH